MECQVQSWSFTEREIREPSQPQSNPPSKHLNPILNTAPDPHPAPHSSHTASNPPAPYPCPPSKSSYPGNTSPAPSAPWQPDQTTLPETQNTGFPSPAADRRISRVYLPLCDRRMRRWRARRRPRRAARCCCSPTGFPRGVGYRCGRGGRRCGFGGRCRRWCSLGRGGSFLLGRLRMLWEFCY